MSACCSRWPTLRPARRLACGDGRLRAASIYAMSIAVYCTSWTYYGSVGRASVSGVGLPADLSRPDADLLPRLAAAAQDPAREQGAPHHLDRRLHRLALRQVGGARRRSSTVIAVIGTVPYIALQLKAVARKLRHARLSGRSRVAWRAITALVAAPAAGGVRDPVRHAPHRRSASTIRAWSRRSRSNRSSSCSASSAIGLFVGLGLFQGFGRSSPTPRRARNSPIYSGSRRSGVDWTALVLLSMAAAFCLPRQFQMIVVENREERPPRARGLGVPALSAADQPVRAADRARRPAAAARRRRPRSVRAELAAARRARAWLALIAFIGGLSAATSMVIVESVALSTMICNDLVMPVLLRLAPAPARPAARPARLLLGIRRGGIVFVLLLGYSTFRFVGDRLRARLDRPRLLRRRRAVRAGDRAWLGLARGRVAGAARGDHRRVPGLGLHAPSFRRSARSGLMPIARDDGLFGIAWTRPYALFGLTGLDPITHSLFWSLLVNIGLLVGCSILVRQSPLEQAQAVTFVDASAESGGSTSRSPGAAPRRSARSSRWSAAFRAGPRRTEFARLARRRSRRSRPSLPATRKRLLSPSGCSRA